MRWLMSGTGAKTVRSDLNGLFFCAHFQLARLDQPPENHLSDFPQVNRIYGHRYPLFR
jgi:hypothetical protein